MESRGCGETFSKLTSSAAAMSHRSLGSQNVKRKFAQHEQLALNEPKPRLQHSYSAVESNDLNSESEPMSDNELSTLKRRRIKGNYDEKYTTVADVHIPADIQQAWNTLLAYAQSKVPVLDGHVVAQSPSHATVSHSLAVDLASSRDYLEPQSIVRPPDKDSKNFQVDGERLLAVLDRLVRKEHRLPLAKVSKTVPRSETTVNSSAKASESLELRDYEPNFAPTENQDDNISEASETASCTGKSCTRTDPPRSPTSSEDDTETDQVDSSIQNSPQNTDSPDRINDHKCQVCQANPESSERETIAELYNTIARLKKENLDLQLRSSVGPEKAPRIQVFHRVSCECSSEEIYGWRNVRVLLFLDTPRRKLTLERRIHFEGSSFAGNVKNYLAQNKEVTLLVYKDYRCKADMASFMKEALWPQQGTIASTSLDPKEASPDSESLVPVSEILCESISWALANSHSNHQPPAVRLGQEIKAPYHHFYHYRSSLRQKINQMDKNHKEHISLFMDYVEESFERSRREASALFSQGLVSYETMPYLFEAGMCVVLKEAGEVVARMSACWLEEEINRESHKELWKLNCWSWKLDDWFWKEAIHIRFDWLGSQDELKQIQSLPVYPLRYAEPGLEDELRARGRKCWSCRKRAYVSYNDQSIMEEAITMGIRYMIDMKTFKISCPDALVKRPDGAIQLDESSEDKENFYLLLPSTVFGFNMQTKNWESLKVACISPVVWNKQAFDNLVVDDATKELLKALLTNQLDAEKATDLIEGKGNGLVVLLHGSSTFSQLKDQANQISGPGTGKTLTAESVAEVACKPLYRVTCGDIGSDADSVDKQLQMVLRLGRQWNCILLDEAEVFLEERSLFDMQRNAVVSVFLRVLEYYDGILILTSNRVGTFDEAFKSRIQLSLHYENLTRTQRRIIWSNFLNRLEDIDKDCVNTGDLKEHLDELAMEDMNGRQIRNALNTARQLAHYRKMPMDYTHLKHAITVAGKFDLYLKTVKHNLTDDQLAREGGVR